MFMVMVVAAKKMRNSKRGNCYCGYCLHKILWKRITEAQCSSIFCVMLKILKSDAQRTQFEVANSPW